LSEDEKIDPSKRKLHSVLDYFKEIHRLKLELLRARVAAANDEEDEKIEPIKWDTPIPEAQISELKDNCGVNPEMLGEKKEDSLQELKEYLEKIVGKYVVGEGDD